MAKAQESVQPSPVLDRGSARMPLQNLALAMLHAYSFRLALFTLRCF